MGGTLLLVGTHLHSAPRDVVTALEWVGGCRTAPQEGDSNPLPLAPPSRSIVEGLDRCFFVMVTTTLCPAMRYSPLTNSWEKRPDLSSPTRVAPFSLAALLALASSEVGLTIVSSW